ncbi:MAG TPA: gas vesicle structural protein GvpA [Ktedonobacteraceae bacterium]
MAIERRQVGRAPGPSSQSGGLVDLIDRILDKGLVIDAWVRISLVGIELITIEARVVVASVDTYLKYAEAIAQTALAAEPRRDGPRVQQIPSDDEIAAYLNDHPDGARIEDIARFFNISRDEVEQIVQRLTSGPRLRMDEKQRDRVYALGGSDREKQRLPEGRRQEEGSRRQEESSRSEESDRQREGTKHPAGSRE